MGVALLAAPFTTGVFDRGVVLGLESESELILVLVLVLMLVLTLCCCATALVVYDKAAGC